MTEQLDLALPLGVKPALEVKLSARQQLAYDYVQSHDGVTADEVGAHLHAHRQPPHHPDTSRCDWCRSEGLSVLRSKAVKPLVTYRVRGDGVRRYIARDARKVTESAGERVSHRVDDDPFAGL